MKKFLFLTVLFISCNASAQTELPPECRVIENHRPSDSVNYQPGVDVHSKPVVPADVNAAPPMGMDGGQTMVIPLSVDMAERLQNQNINGLELGSTLGFIEVGPGGRVTYNGQDLTQQVHVLCGEPPAPPADGQPAADTVEYAPVKPKPKGAPAPKPVTPNYPKVETPALKAPAPQPEPKKPEQGELIEGGEYR